MSKTYDTIRINASGIEEYIKEDLICFLSRMMNSNFDIYEAINDEIIISGEKIGPNLRNYIKELAEYSGMNILYN